MAVLSNLPEEKQKEIEAMGDNWDWHVVTERELRDIRRYKRSLSIT